MSRRRIEYWKDVAATNNGSEASNSVRALIAVLHWRVSVIHNSTYLAMRQVVPIAAISALLLVAPVAGRAQSTAQTDAPASPATAKAASSAAYPKVGEILDRYEKAIGGRDAW